MPCISWQEAMKPAYADRAAWLGDPERFRVPVRGLTAKRYADGQRAAIDGKRARPAEAIRAGDPLPHEADQTTHFSVVDLDGNAVANTYTLNFSYGLGLVAAGTGVLLNNEMDDFSAKAGAQNAYGLVGGDTNLAAPGARPLVHDADLRVPGRAASARHRRSRRQPHHLDGAAGHRQRDFRMNLAEAVAAPRVHHQWRPDALLVETGLSPDTLHLLRGAAIRWSSARRPGRRTRSCSRRRDGWERPIRASAARWRQGIRERCGWMSGGFSRICGSVRWRLSSPGPDRLRRGQHDPDARGAGQIRLERGSEPIPAPRRPDPESRRDREGLRPAGAQVLTQVTEARAGRRRFRWTPRRSPIREVQGIPGRAEPASGALGRLLVTVERYPDLKSNANFLALQSQLEGAENRIAVARRDYIETVRAYNTELRTIPGRWIAAVPYPANRAPWRPSATAGSERPPQVRF